MWEIETSQIPFTEFDQYKERVEVLDESESNSSSSSNAKQINERSDMFSSQPIIKLEKEQTKQTTNTKISNSSNVEKQNTAPPLLKRKSSFFNFFSGIFSKKKQNKETKEKEENKKSDKKQKKNTTEQAKKNFQNKTTSSISSSSHSIKEKQQTNPSTSSNSSNSSSRNTKNTKIIEIWRNEGNEIKRDICDKDLRPSVPESCPFSELIKSCFQGDPSLRPSFFVCVNFLRKLFGVDLLVKKAFQIVLDSVQNDVSSILDESKNEILVKSNTILLQKVFFYSI